MSASAEKGLWLELGGADEADETGGIGGANSAPAEYGPECMP